VDDRTAPTLVIGLGRSGVAAARLAVEDGAPVRVTDVRTADELDEVVAALPTSVEAVLGGHPASCLDGVRRVVVSPGVPADAPLLVAARAAGLEVLSEVEFAWRHRPDAPLVAVTGSNGKSTVTTLVGEMLRAGGLSTAVGGNLGTASSQLVLEGGWECWVLEVSSFQTELFVDLRPRVGVFLNLSQDHLERHVDLAAYAAAKQRLFAAQRPQDAAVLNADDVMSAATPTAARRRLFSVGQAADAWLDGTVLVLEGEPLVPASEVALVGRHNLANALAAVLAADEMGIDRASMGDVLRTFRGLDHRHREVWSHDGVRWIDDSKATNVGATLAALGGYPDGSVHLILGGQAKGQDFSILRDEVARATRRVYLIGVDAAVIAAALGAAVPVETCGDLAEAVRRARRLAVAGEWVLLAPACASFDQFSGYAERGDRFAELARGEEVAPCP